MKKLMYAFVAVAFMCTATGCAENKTRVGEGAGMGGLLGATIGGIVGHQSGNGVAGALIGGAAGAAGGAMAGSQMTKKTTTTTTTEVPSIMPVTMQQVVDLTKQGVSTDEIIGRIKASNPHYALTADDIDYLKRQSVSQRVIETMQVYR